MLSWEGGSQSGAAELDAACPVFLYCQPNVMIALPEPVHPIVLMLKILVYMRIRCSRRSFALIVVSTPSRVQWQWQALQSYLPLSNTCNLTSYFSDSGYTHCSTVCHCHSACCLLVPTLCLQVACPTACSYNDSRLTASTPPLVPRSISVWSTLTL